LTYSHDNLTVTLTPIVEQFFKNLISSYDFRYESGGILVGTMKDGVHLEITDITVPQPKDRRLPFGFHRAESGHQQHMDNLWEQSGYQKMYLGEWHTHREAYPLPSCIDTSGWRKIARKKQNSPWMLFLIVGQREFHLWTVSQGVIKELIPHAE
jgi:integrative and conjugative element protein (TIGR02256 family)